MEFFLTWSGIGIVAGAYALLYGSTEDIDDDDKGYMIIGMIIFGAIGGPIFALWSIKAVNEDKKALSKIKKDEERRIKYAEKRKEKALKDYPLLLKDLEETLKLIENNESSIDKKFFDNIKKIISYCAVLNINKTVNKKVLRDVLIFARINVLQFYENNNIKNANTLSKKINATLKKIKND